MADALTMVATAAAKAVEATKTYGSGPAAVHALAGVSVDFPAHRYTAIMGPSGSGKSTLMQCVAGLDRLTSGSAFVGDTDISTLDKTQLTLLRRDRLGFIFQQYNLIPTLSSRENMLLPLTLAGRDPDQGGSTRSLRPWACQISSTGFRASFRAASSSGSRSRARSSRVRS